MISMEERIYLEHEEISASQHDRTDEVHAFEFETFELRPNENNANSSIFKRIWISLPRNIHIVLFKSRVNMLLPFGPIAILVHHLSEKQVRSATFIIIFDPLQFDKLHMPNGAPTKPFVRMMIK